MTTSPRRLLVPALAALCLLCAGCNIFGVAAQALPVDQIGPVKPGLAGQTVAVMVWVDRGLRMDFPTLRSDIANSIQGILQNTPSADLKGAQYISPLSVVRYQDDHPEIDALSIEEVAPRLHVSHVIYVEVQDFQTHSPHSLDLYHGSITANLRVVVVDQPDTPQAHAKVVFEEGGVRTEYPKNRPEGIEAPSPQPIYILTIQHFGTEIAQHFYTHDASQDY